MDSLLFFNPYIGDTLLSMALANKISNHFDESVYVASINEEMYMLTNDLGGMGFHYPELGDFVSEGAEYDLPLVKTYMGGTDFSYTYHVSNITKQRIEDLCEKIIYGLSPITFDQFYILHYSYAYAKLGQMAKERGVKVIGYCLDDDGRLYFSGRDTDFEVPSIWDKGFIGDRLSKLVTGHPLTRQDYADLGGNLHRKGIKLFPTTRGIQQSAGNWETDISILSALGKNFTVLWHMRESSTLKHYLKPSQYGMFNSMWEMANSIKSAELIICYDSASFHLAWLTNTPAIVKLKGGFNEEWIPSWVKDDPNYFFIPATMMYEEEYVTYLTTGLRQLGVKL